MEGFDELADLMAEAPGGRGWGRKRVNGDWVTLDQEEQQAWTEDYWVEPHPEPLRRPDRPEDTIRHGTVSAYNNQRCRCPECRDAIAEYRRQRRVQS